MPARLRPYRPAAPATTVRRLVPAIVELRQYTLRPGRRDELIELFDREYVDGQEELGIDVLGQFRDLDEPDRFVWLRGFPDLDGRGRALTAFYDGPLWQRTRDQANATMLDSDDVLLLRTLPMRTAERERSFALPDRVDEPDGGVVTITVFYPEPGAAAALVDAVEHRFAGADEPALLGLFVTEPGANTFPRLPIREGEDVVVSVVGALDAPEPVSAVAGCLRPPDVRRLAATPRSRFRSTAIPTR